MIHGRPMSQVIVTLGAVMALLALLFQPGYLSAAFAQAALTSLEHSRAAPGEDEAPGFGWYVADRGDPMASSHAMAYDSARGVTVLFGGLDSLDETWEWDGAEWTLRSPANNPTPRYGHAMAYDSARGVTVLFGGHYYEDGWYYLDDTWEWDGTNWTERFPANHPTPRYDHALAYDSVRGVTVLFGGYSSQDGSLDDTWEWDGTNWTRRYPQNSPAERDHHAMAYDSVRGVTVLFGGFRPVQFWGDTWEWDGTDWIQRFPANSPSARYAHAMAYDSARGVTVLFAGRGELDDTWEWDGTNWTQCLPANQPMERYNHAMAYDSAREVTILFGGYHGSITYGGKCSDTWEWDGTEWALRPSPNNLTRRVDHAMAYDGGRGVTVLFGGNDSTGRLNDTWEWDGMQWTQRFPANIPEKRHDHALVYDSAREVMVLFGGWDYEYGFWYWDTTWEWDGTDWTLRSPPDRPTARHGHAMAYDSTRGVTVLFGGYNSDVGYFGDTWEWDGTNWTHRSPANRPKPQYGHAMAYDSARGVTVLFGRGETWEWDGADWTQRAPADEPAARSNHAMAYDSARGVTVLFGGADANGSVNDTWGWDGANWVRYDDANSPPARGYHAMAYDSARTVTVLFGGERHQFGEDVPNDTWAYRPPPPPPALAPIDNPDGDGNYLVTWSAVAGALTYTLQEDVAPTFTTPAVRYEGGETQFQVTGQAATTWYYRVRASTGATDTSWSDIEAVVVAQPDQVRVYLPLVLHGTP